MTVEKLFPSHHVAERWYCALDSGETLTVGTAEIADLGLYIGRALTEEEAEALRAAAGKHKAREKALRLAGGRSMSRRELERKLTSRGITDENAAETAEWMEHIGLVNDGEYARAIVRHYSAAGYGLGRVKDELYRRGIPKEQWEDALSLMPDTAEVLDTLVAVRLRDGADDPKHIKKLTDMLLRRGFSWEEIKNALRRCACELDENGEA